MSYSIRVNLHGHCSMCIYYFINFCSHQFFSLFSVHNNLSSSSCFPQMHTNTSTQINQHRNTPTHKQTHTDKPTERYGSPVKKGYGSPKLGSWIGRWKKDLGRRAWFVDRPVKKGFRSSSLVLGSAGEERICVAGAWFVDRPMKKGSGSAGEERTRWRSDLGW